MKSHIFFCLFVILSLNIYNSYNFSIDKAVEYLVYKCPNTRNWCARAVKHALVYGGGLSQYDSCDAWACGGFLTKNGFVPISKSSRINFQKGDVVIYDRNLNNPSRKYGHIQMYSGSNWYCDFKQKDFWVWGSPYPTITVYRYKGTPSPKHTPTLSPKRTPTLSPNRTPTLSPKRTPTLSPYIYTVTYQVRVNGNKWYQDVENLNDYAGDSKNPITDIKVCVSHGSVNYQVHLVAERKWLPMVSGCNRNDAINGFAGKGKIIDAIRIQYKGNKTIKYRVAPIGGSYYNWQNDIETSNGQDGYAGYFGKPIGKVQITFS